MKLLNYWAGGRQRLGIAVESGVIAVQSAAARLRTSAPATMAQLFADFAGGVRVLERLQDRAAEGGALLDESNLVLGPPVPPGGKIVGIGLNYRAHAAEAGLAVPESPVVFAKFANTVVQPGAVIELPPGEADIDYEAELAIVIGRSARRIRREDALGYVAGYMNANDVSARGLQFRTSQWTLGKSCDGFCPVGPYLVTADEIDPGDLRITCEVNGALRQAARTSDMIFACDALISYLSTYLTLEPGDIILTGTPAGVAAGRPDRPWLREGDHVVVAIEGLGRLENRVGKVAGGVAP